MNRQSAAARRSIVLSLFDTSIGWIGIAGSQGRLFWCTLGHARRAAAERAARLTHGDKIVVRDWNPQVRRRLTDYAAGKPVAFDDLDLDLDLDGVPAFHRRVLVACSRIGYGRTITYAELAAAAGRPRAVRAAATAMAQNPLPIIVPCHRVVRSDGGLGGYSAPQGVSLKRQLLDMEAGANDDSAVGLIAKSPRRATKRARHAARTTHSA